MNDVMSPRPSVITQATVVSLVMALASNVVLAESPPVTSVTVLKAQVEAANVKLIDSIAEGRSLSAGAKPVAPSKKIEKEVLVMYSSVESYCALQKKDLAARHAALTKKDAHLNAWGGLLALIGGVAAYAPVKAVLMGVGISSSGGSNSIFGSMVSSTQKEATTTTNDLNSLRSSYTAGVDAYESINANDDLLGTKRFNALTQIKAACDGLSAIQAGDGS